MDTWSKMYYDNHGIKKENLNEKLLLKYQFNLIIDKLESIDNKINKINSTNNIKINNIETNKNFTYNYLKTIYNLISKIWNKMYTACATNYYQYKK